jgi:hypothetical protein
VDSRIVDDPEIRWDEVERVTKTAFWCIQSEASLRPSMGKVVQMLAGNVSIEEPVSLNFFTFLQGKSVSSPSISRLPEDYHYFSTYLEKIK